MPVVRYEALRDEFERVLRASGVEGVRAAECAGMFADTTLAGVFSHGVNRFPRFIAQLRAGHVQPDAEPSCLLSLGALEQWDGHRGIGNLTARRMMDRAIELAAAHGIGLVALRNTNHWMRGGTYGYQAAEKGYIGICWTNTIALMPPWGAKDSRVGNNPLVVAVPGTPITLVDLAMSMFSYGALETHRLAGRPLPVDGGYDEAGALTRDPAAIEKTRRILPMGFWKGSGLTIALDMIATLLSGGLSTIEVSQDLEDEYSVSQVFIAIDAERTMDGASREAKLERIRGSVLSAAPVDPARPQHIPGHELPARIAAHRTNGILVNDGVWEKIKAL